MGETKKPATGARIEYKVVDLRPTATRTVEAQLNEFGIDGWEIRSVEWRAGDSAMIILFRGVDRERQEPAPTERYYG